MSLFLLGGATLAAAVPHDGHAATLQLSAGPTSTLHNNLAWLHIPKCGSSFRATINTVYTINPCCIDQSNLTRYDATFSCVVDDLDNGCTGFEARIDSPKFDASRDLPSYWPRPFADHTQVSEQAYDAFKGHFVGLFREPRARAASSVRFFGMEPGESKAAALQRTAGTQTRQLAGQDFGTVCNDVDNIYSLPCPPAADRAPPNLSLAMQRLDEGFAFVGLTDAFALSICLFHAMHGGECTASEFANLNPTTPELDHNLTEADMYAHSTQFDDPADGALFAAARHRFCADVAHHDVTHETCAKRICPHAAARLVSVPPSADEPGEKAALCEGHDKVLKFR